MPSTRATLVAEAAITLLAERGMRGLTHRAVDEAAGLPPGSTSNVARSRAALLELALARLTELERRTIAGLGRDGGDLAEALARFLHGALHEDRQRTLARYELALEATRRPELRAIYDAIGRDIRRATVSVMAAAGSTDPDRHGHALVAFMEGVMFDAVAGAGRVPGLDDLRLTVREYLAAMLPATSPG
ncbi:TetR/AcrR family transcriptional regulator [Actinomadura sp. WMMA1423]|uniref:TetR/AcrR family transcriptional regulator n=1 Tax=Actinomadura sp. WMMA1423 TaxID=2591108 RepID=UPI00197A91B5|nr:TetR/AcrR family transcriptional regulator [Actinomadura sp. WMMA1423]